jgi:membrane-associated phospholipid phosphatase
VTPRRYVILAAWCVAFALALVVDRRVATWVHDSGLSIALKSHWKWATKVARLPGNFLSFPLIVSAGLFLQGKRWWRPALFVFLSGVLTALNSVIKWIVGRARPFQGDIFGLHPFVGGLHGMGGPNQSFPSGDVCLAAATAASLMILFPRGRWWMISIIILVAVERVSEGAHYPSDCIGGAALGCSLAHLAWRVLGRPGVPQKP